LADGHRERTMKKGILILGLLAHIGQLMEIRMKYRFYISLLIIIGLLSCGKRTNPVDNSKSRMKLNFQVIPEDYEKHFYTVEWKDTLGQSEGYVGHKWFTRPKEIWCVLTNHKNDTLGYYMGLSTAQTFASFQSTDTLVTLNFMIGLNFFSDKFGSGKDMFEFENNAKEYSNDNRLPIVFKPIQLNLKTDLQKNYDIELKEK
jgi:hypothetical protein